jgi:hypothetical protein
MGIALIRTTSNREWVSKLYVLIRGFTKLTTCSKVLQGSRVDGRMAGYIDDFKNHRVQLQEALSLYTASNAKLLVTKMSSLVSRLLETKPYWEKTLATKTQKLEDRSEWIESDAALQAVVSAAEDSVLGAS